MMVEQWEQLCASYAMARSDAQEDVDSDEECALLGAAHNLATERLLLAPAPDLQALLHKLEIFDAEDCFELSDQYRAPLFAALLADVRSLAKGAD
jgi:hypothetical protein